MKKSVSIMLIISLISIGRIFSQETSWSKDGRSIVYTEFSDAVSPYKNLSQEQKETLSLCCLDEITKQFDQKEYQSKLDIELRRIKSAIITQCGKKLGFDLSIAQQSNDVSDWNKESRSNLYNEALAVFNTYELSAHQREVLSLCFMNEISNNYSKSQLESMIEAEIKKVKNNAYNKCLDDNNIQLKSITSKKVDTKSISGVWQSYNFDIYFYDTGEYEKFMDKGLHRKTKGKWFLEGTKIILVHDKTIKEEYEITNFSGDSMKFENKENNIEFHLKKLFNY